MLPKWLYTKDVRGDWHSIKCCGFEYTRYANGATYFKLSTWFKTLLCAAAIGAVVAVVSLCWEYVERTKCQEHGLIVGKDVKYSARAGCYVLVGQEYRRVYFD